jgi:multidrug efflux pump subunit AcrA (membrane-fusion protein)
MMRTTRKLTVVGSSVIVLVAMAIAQLVGQERPSRSGPSPLPLPVSTKNAANPARIANAASNGWLQFDECPVFALETIDVPSQESGVIATIDVAENDTVSEQQVLGRFEMKVAELEKGVAGLQAQVAAAEANDESDIRLAEAIVEESQLQVEVFEVTTARGSTGESELRQKQLTLVQAKVRLNQAKSIKQQKELKSKLAQAGLFLSQQKLDRLALKSPIAGTVTQIDHHPGEWVQAGTTIMKLIRLDALRVDCLVDIHALDPVSMIRQPVQVIATRGNQETQYVGKIVSYDPDVSGAGKVRVRAVVQNQKRDGNWQLLPGMSVRMLVTNPQ